MQKKTTSFNTEKIEKLLRELGNKIDELSVKARQEAGVKYNETIDKLTGQMNELFKKLNDNLDSQTNEWNAKIEKLTGKTKEDARQEFEEMRSNILNKVNEYRKTANDLRQSGSGAWAEIITGAEKAWKEMKTSLTNAISKFK